jgi:hypothetical protein
MNNIVPLRAGQMPAIFQGRANLPDMAKATGQGLAAAFCVIGYKGKNWRLKYRGEDVLVKDDKGVPLPSLPVIIVGVSPAISKQWYDKKYAEGDNEAPDCFSINGIAPDPASPKIQSPSCAACPQNVWGSRINDNGKKAKSCQDSRRIAVVPLGDIENEGYGGPMMLRVPPMSLANLAKFGTDVQRFGAQPFMVATELGFDYDVAYPLIKFTALGWLDEAQAVAVAKAMEDPLIERMLETEAVEATADPVGEASALSSGGPAQAFTGATPAVQTPAPTPSAAHVNAEAQAALAAQAERQEAARQQAEKQAFEAAWASKQKADAEAALVAARAKWEAEQAAKNAQPVQAEAATVGPKKSPFGGGVSAAPVTSSTPVVTSSTPLAETNSTTSATTIMQPAPTDMDAAIDDLLAS